MGFRCPACSPLAVVASELTLGATAYEGRGRGERSCGPRGGWRLRSLESRLLYKSVESERDLEEQQVVAWKEAGIKIMRKAKLPNVSLDRDEDGGSAG